MLSTCQIMRLGQLVTLLLDTACMIMGKDLWWRGLEDIPDYEPHPQMSPTCLGDIPHVYELLLRHAVCLWERSCLISVINICSSSKRERMQNWRMKLEVKKKKVLGKGFYAVCRCFPRPIKLRVFVIPNYLMITWPANFGTVLRIDFWVSLI